MGRQIHSIPLSVVPVGELSPGRTLGSLHDDWWLTNDCAIMARSSSISVFLLSRWCLFYLRYINPLLLTCIRKTYHMWDKHVPSIEIIEQLQFEQLTHNQCKMSIDMSCLCHIPSAVDTPHICQWLWRIINTVLSYKIVILKCNHLEDSFTHSDLIDVIRFYVLLISISIAIRERFSGSVTPMVLMKVDGTRPLFVTEAAWRVLKSHYILLRMHRPIAGA